MLILVQNINYDFSKAKLQNVLVMYNFLMSYSNKYQSTVAPFFQMKYKLTHEYRSEPPAFCLIVLITNGGKHCRRSHKSE